MNRRQRALLIESAIVLAATVAAVAGMMHLKDYVNRSEAMRAMTELGREIRQHRDRYGLLPPQSFIEEVKTRVAGAARIGNVQYRALWIGPDAPADSILAYSRKQHGSSFLKDGYVVLRLDNTVEWMPTAQFVDLFARQRAPAEPELPRE